MVDKKEFLLSKTLEYYCAVTSTDMAGFDSARALTCVFPDHIDSSPSMYYYPKDNRFYCFGCRRKADIFDLAAIFEGLSITGPAFYDTVEELYSRFSEEGVYVLDKTYQIEKKIYDNISKYFKEMAVPPPEAYGIKNLPKGVYSLYEIGIINNLSEFYDKILEDIPVTVEKLQTKILNGTPFGPSKLTFILRNELGQIVGFLCRNLSYESQVEEYNVADESVKKELKHPVKYIYYTNKLYKSDLYNLFTAKKNNYAKIIVTESAKAVVRLSHLSFLNTVAACTNTLSKSHIQALSFVSEILLAYDNDSAGQHGVISTLNAVIDSNRFIELKVVDYGNSTKKGIDDHEDNEIAQLLNNPITIIEYLYKIDYYNALSLSIEYISLCKLATQQSRLIKILSEVSGSNYADIKKDITDRRRLREGTLANKVILDIKKAIDLTSKRISSEEEIDKNLPSLFLPIENLITNFKTTVSKDNSFSQKEILSSVIKLFEGFESIKESRLIGWKTGIPFFDEMMEGLPKKDSSIILGGLANVGKSAFMINLLCNILSFEENEDILVALVTNDDSKSKTIPKIIANISEIPITFCKSPNKYLVTTTQKRLYLTAKNQLLSWMDAKNPKLSIVDAATISTVQDCIDYVKYLQDATQKNILLFLDNFHNLYMPGTNKVTATSDAILTLHASTQKYGYTLISTAEIRKGTLGDIKRKPTFEDLKDSVDISYVGTIVGLLWSQFSATIPGSTPKPGTFWSKSGQQKPVLECIIDKNKADIVSETANRTILYFKFDPSIAKMIPMSIEEHDQLLQGSPTEDTLKERNSPKTMFLKTFKENNNV